MEQTLLVTAVVLLLLVLASLWLFLYQIVKQQGRILLRLDQLEVASRAGAAAGAQAGAQAAAQAAPEGLAVGETFEPFALPDIEGRTVSLADFRGAPVLVVNWDPACGFCDLAAAELAKLQPDMREHGVGLVLVSRGDAERNRKLVEAHGLECPVLLLEGASQLKPFEYMGTPVAYLLDAEGKVARPLATGAFEAPALAREAVESKKGGGRKRLPGERPVGESRIVREGLKAGTPAPAFSLPDIRGGATTLEQFRGRRVLLVFSDPHCGPCDALAPDLARLHREHRDNGLAVVMVGRGDAEENRRKAAEHGFEFPVVLQEHWRLSKEYGIFATPVAFLIDEQGVIARDVGKGADEILALAREGLGTQKGA
ncbi:MAG TPA: TlpA disulfide reductase family protein [Pyrinomonadaceae bacterium]|jgi:peroxiredoxin